MAAFRVIPRSAVLGDVPSPMAQPFRGVPAPIRQPFMGVPAVAPSMPTTDSVTEKRLATLEENMRRMATSHQKLVVAVQKAIGQLRSNDVQLEGHLGNVAMMVGYSPQAQGRGNTPGVPTHTIPQPQVAARPQARPFTPAAGQGPVVQAPPQAQNAQQTVADAAEDLFYGEGTDEDLFYSGEEGA